MTYWESGICLKRFLHKRFRGIMKNYRIVSCFSADKQYMRMGNISDNSLVGADTAVKNNYIFGLILLNKYTLHKNI